MKLVLMLIYARLKSLFAMEHRERIYIKLVDGQWANAHQMIQLTDVRKSKLQEESLSLVGTYNNEYYLFGESMMYCWRIEDYIHYSEIQEQFERKKYDKTYYDILELRRELNLSKVLK